MLNKKVLLRERKRHTARRVASARYAGGEGGTPSSHDGGGYPIQSWWGGGVPHPVMVVPKYKYYLPSYYVRGKVKHFYTLSHENENGREVIHSGRKHLTDVHECILEFFLQLYPERKDGESRNHLIVHLNRNYVLNTKSLQTADAKSLSFPISLSLRSIHYLWISHS